jgi:hypothetical protein
MNALEKEFQFTMPSNATISGACRVVNAASTRRPVNEAEGVKAVKPLYRYAWVGPSMPSGGSSPRQQQSGCFSSHRLPLSVAENSDNDSGNAVGTKPLTAAEAPLLPVISRPSSAWTPTAGSCFRPPASRQAVDSGNQEETSLEFTGVDENRQYDGETINVVRMLSICIL